MLHLDLGPNVDAKKTARSINEHLKNLLAMIQGSIKTIITFFKDVSTRFWRLFFPKFKESSLYNLDKDFDFLKKETGIKFSFLFVNSLTNVFSAYTLPFIGGIVVIHTKMIDKINSTSVLEMADESLKNEVKAAKIKMLQHERADIEIREDDIEITEDDIKRHLIRAILAHELGHSQQKIKILRQGLTELGLQSFLNEELLNIIYSTFVFFKIPFKFFYKVLSYVDFLKPLIIMGKWSADSKELEYDADDYAAKNGYREASIFMHKYVFWYNTKAGEDRYFKYPSSFFAKLSIFFRKFTGTHPSAQERIDNLKTNVTEPTILKEETTQEDSHLNPVKKTVFEKVKSFFFRASLLEPIEEIEAKNVKIFSDQKNDIQNTIQEAVKIAGQENVSVYISPYGFSSEIVYYDTYLGRHLVIPSNLIMQMEYLSSSKLEKIGKDKAFKKQYNELYHTNNSDIEEQSLIADEKDSQNDMSGDEQLSAQNIKKALFQSLIVSKMHAMGIKRIVAKTCEYNPNAQIKYYGGVFNYELEHEQDDTLICEKKMNIIFSHVLEIGLDSSSFSAINEEDVQDPSTLSKIRGLTLNPATHTSERIKALRYSAV